MRMEDNINESKIWEERKKVCSSHKMYYAPRSTRRTSTLLDLGPTPRILLFSRRVFFFVRGPAGPTSSSGGLVQTALWVLP